MFTFKSTVSTSFKGTLPRWYGFKTHWRRVIGHTTSSWQTSAESLHLQVYYAELLDTLFLSHKQTNEITFTPPLEAGQLNPRGLPFPAPKPMSEWVSCPWLEVLTEIDFIFYFIKPGSLFLDATMVGLNVVLPVVWKLVSWKAPCGPWVSRLTLCPDHCQCWLPSRLTHTMSFQAPFLLFTSAQASISLFFVLAYFIHRHYSWEIHPYLLGVL